MKRLSYYIALLAAVLLSACSSEEAIDTEEPLPDGMGQLRLTVTTRAVLEDDPEHPVHEYPWETPDHLWEVMHSLRVIICKASDNTVMQIVTVTDQQIGNSSVPTPTQAYTTDYVYNTVEVTSQPLPVGHYHVFATANYADGYSVGDVVNLDETVKFANGYSETNIPMTGKLTDANGMKSVSVANSPTPTDAGTLTVWRVMGKLQFEFKNETSQKVRIKGIEVEPINQASSSGPGIYLFSKDDLTSLANLVPMFAANTTKTGVSATWPLNTSPLQTTASVSTGGVFSSTALTYGDSKLTPSGLRTAGEVNLYKFEAAENLGSTRDNDAVITFTVTPATGMTFTPKNVTFKACRGATDGGNFDVVAVSGGTTTTLATGERPARYNGDKDENDNRVPPYTTEYSYPLSGTPTTGSVVVKIYLYNLASGKDYAFSDVAISGDVTNNTGSALQEALTLPDGARTDVGMVNYEPSSALELEAKDDNSTDDEGTLFFYVNETDATYTTVENQLSVRFKIQRWSGSDWYDDEVRYGFTTHYSDGTTGHNGFNVIRRNDWIHIPVVLRDWTFRVEPLAFVPIAGYPATTLSSDALTATFSTGGMIALQPYVKKRSDSTWRDFSDPEVTFVSLTWKNSDGTDVSGSGKIIETPFTYDTANHCIVGELNNSLSAGTYKTTVTVNVKLGPTGSQFDYSFTCNVILKKL